MTNQETPLLPGADAASRLIELRTQGLTVKEAAATAHVSERQAYRLLNQYGSRPGSLERWSPSTALDDLPEKVDYLFDTLIQAGWSRSEADLAWAIHSAREDMEPQEVKSFCRLYAAAQDATGLVSERRILLVDWVLTFWPWEDEQELEDLIRRVPVVDKEEMTYVAQVTNYLNRHLSQNEGDPATVKYVTTATDFDRMDFFESELQRIQQEEIDRIANMPPNRLAVVEVPGHERKRGRPRKRRKG